MSLSEKLKSAAPQQVQRLLRTLDETEVEILLMFHLDAEARQIIKENMSARAWRSVSAEAERLNGTPARAESYLDSIAV